MTDESFAPKKDPEQARRDLSKSGLLAGRTDDDPFATPEPSLKDIKGSRADRGYKPWEPKGGRKAGGGGGGVGAGPT